MDVLLRSSELQANLVLALAGATSAYVTVTRPTLVHAKGQPSACPPATLVEAGTSPLLPTRRLALFRGLMAVYILAMGAVQARRLGVFVFKFYTIWNWWLLGLYFALAAVASLVCARLEAAAGSSDGGRPTPPAGAANGPGREPQSPQPRKKAGGGSSGSGSGSGHVVSRSASGPSRLASASGLSRLCHALFLINCSTVIIVDVVCWTVLYPMLARGPQTPEIQRIIRRLLMTFTSYNQHGLNALYIFADLFLNRHRLAFHAVGPLGLWSLAYGLWAHVWHAHTGKWLYPFLDTSKPWAPSAYFGLYLVHWAAFGLVALLFRLREVVQRRLGPGRAVAPMGLQPAGGKHAKAE